MCYDDWTFSLFFPFTQRGILIVTNSPDSGGLSQLKSQVRYLVRVAFSSITWTPWVCFLVYQVEIIKGIENPVFSRTVIVSLSMEDWKDLSWMRREASSGWLSGSGRPMFSLGFREDSLWKVAQNLLAFVFMPIEVGLSPKLIQLDSLS